MAKNLWELRMARHMTVKQLAGKAGVSASDIYAYESGKLVKTAHRARLAKALYVDTYEIKAQSDPKPKKEKPKPAAVQRPSPKPTPAPAKSKTAPPKPVAKKKQKMASKPVRESQITHLLQLARSMGQTETAVTETIGKPLTELTMQEASHWLNRYTEDLQAFKAKRAAESDSERPPNTRRKRYHLPEGVDEFEFNYLTARQEAGDLLAFKLFDGTEMNGRIVGFSPYTITIAPPDGPETTINKIALAYYAVVPTAATPAAEEAV